MPVLMAYPWRALKCIFSIHRMYMYRHYQLFALATLMLMPETEPNQQPQHFSLISRRQNEHSNIFECDSLICYKTFNFDTYGKIHFFSVGACVRACVRLNHSVDLMSALPMKILNLTFPPAQLNYHKFSFWFQFSVSKTFRSPSLLSPGMHPICARCHRSQTTSTQWQNCIQLKYVHLPLWA